MLYEWRSLNRASAPRSPACSANTKRHGSGARSTRRQRPAAPTSVLARLLIFGALNWSVQWFDPRSSASLDDMTDAAMELFIHPELP